MGNKHCLCLHDDGADTEAYSPGGTQATSRERGRQAAARSLHRAPPDNPACVKAFLADIDSKMMSVPCVGGEAWNFRPGCNPKNTGMLSAGDIEKVVARLANANKVKRLELLSRGLDDAGATSLARWLGSAAASQCTYISLSHNNITDVGATALAHALRHNATLKQLRLDGNCFGSEALGEVGQALRENTGLQHLDMCVGYGSLPLPSSAVKDLTAGLAGNASLKTLKISGENCRERRGPAVPCVIDPADLGAAFEKLADNHVITELSFTYLLGGGTASADRTPPSTREAGASSAVRRCLAQCAALLIKNRTLTTVDFTGNLMGDEGGVAIADALAEGTAVQTLHLGKNALGNAALSKLGEALGKARGKLTRLDLSNPFALRPMDQEWPAGSSGNAPIAAPSKGKKSGKAKAAKQEAAGGTPVDLTEGVVALCKGLETCYSLETLLLLGIDLNERSRTALVTLAERNGSITDVRYKTEGGEIPALAAAVARNSDAKTKQALADSARAAPSQNQLLSPKKGAGESKPAAAARPPTSPASPHRKPELAFRDDALAEGGGGGAEDEFDIEFNNDDAYD